MPITPFIGVRISWLIVAKNALLARALVSASSFAANSSCCACLRSVMSRTMATKRGSPPACCTSCKAISTGMSCPSLCR